MLNKRKIRVRGQTPIVPLPPPFVEGHKHVYSKDDEREYKRIGTCMLHTEPARLYVKTLLMMSDNHVSLSYRTTLIHFMRMIDQEFRVFDIIAEGTEPGNAVVRIQHPSMDNSVWVPTTVINRNWNR